MEITTELLNDIWNNSKDMRADMCKRRRYYTGEHDICNRNEKHADGKKKANIPTNFAEYVVDMYVGAMTTAPWQVTKLDDNTNDPATVYNELSRDAMLDVADVENLRNALICGYGLEVHEFVDGKPRVIPEHPENWALLRDENDEIVIAITRFVMPANSVFRGELFKDSYEIQYMYTATERVGYKRKYRKNIDVGAVWEEFDRAPHMYGSVPVVEMRWNDDRRSLLSDALLSQVDEYNDIDSLSGDDIRNVSDALLVIKGISSEWVLQNQDLITGKRILPIPDDAEASYLTKTTDIDRITSRLSRCREAIHTMASVPDIQQVVGVTGGTSGIALQLKFMPMQQRAGMMVKQLEKAIRRRIDLLNSMTGPAQQRKIENYQINIGFYMPINRIEEWQNIGGLTGIVSHRTQLELLTDIDDPESELKELDKDEATKAETAAVNQAPDVAAARQDAQVAATVPDVEAQVQRMINTISDAARAALVKA